MTSGPAFPWERFAFTAAIWMGLAVGWVAACLWVERDSREALGRTRPWKQILAALGVAFALATYQFGASAVTLMGWLLPLVMVAYVGLRETIVSPDERLLPVDVIGDAVRRAARATGVEAWLQRLASRKGDVVAIAGADAPILLKKDGTEYGVAGQRGLDRELSQAIKTAQAIFGQAIAVGATDIHFEPKSGHEVQLRYRIDGMLQNQSTLAADVGRAVVSALKVVGDMDIAEKRRPQDGTFAVLAGGRKFDVRANSGPTNFGEKIALRMLDPAGGILKQGLAGLGIRESMLQALRGIVHRSHGMLIVCGPTGSGKTTTVYGALSEIDVLTRNIVTIEDPIEYRLDNISQTAVNNAADLTFAKILRAVLRQDPDVILVGEIRDRETAEIAMQAALTGHFVFTTLHANDAATTVARLLDIGIDATLIQSAVTAVLAQRLVRLLCPKCKQAYTPATEELQRQGLPPDRVKVLYREQGCAACNRTGYKGRTGVYELMVVDGPMRSLLVGRPSIEVIRQAALKAGMRSLRRAAIIKVAEGLTSLAEIDRVVPDESPGRARA
jgi:general secretion pathway protein E